MGSGAGKLVVEPTPRHHCADHPDILKFIGSFDPKYISISPKSGSQYIISMATGTDGRFLQFVCTNMTSHYLTAKVSSGRIKSNVCEIHFFEIN